MLILDWIASLLASTWAIKSQISSVVPCVCCPEPTERCITLAKPSQPRRGCIDTRKTVPPYSVVLAKQKSYWVANPS
ncbi:hypothetical protein EV356DRAFT_212125 [Viridothelium virens]|uniref:Secreted protein n=1 Tax=Viridothelium virens TaxID=1048519 RepID=A0A6A6H590_VIRVR|nr:hypothetical protein EV356DRAFT_212125 [Viridothelium virens]